MILSFIDINLKASYESGIDDLIRDFYLPVLSQAISYDRIAGFFSSSSLAIAARGIAGLIQNKGKMRLIASPRLSKEDAEVMNRAVDNSEQFFSGILLRDIDSVTSDFEKDQLQALGWMLQNGYLEMKIAKVNNPNDIELIKGLFHQKVGVFTDTLGNKLSFSGSINESASGWIHNVEEFKVFREWIEGHKEFYLSDEKRFSDFWNNNRDNVKIYDLPAAVKNHLIEKSKSFSIERYIATSYINISTDAIEDRLSLFPYQKEAVEMWKDNEYKLLFEMATGAGKTRTALACVNSIMSLHSKLAVIIACPQTTLSKQWKNNEVEKAGLNFDDSVIADGTNRLWRQQLSTALNKISVGFNKNIVIYTTHTTASSDDFIKIIDDSNDNIHVCFIGDEAHGLGALRSQYALLPKYDYRIGLSATPRRWFDDVGSQIISNYFGGNAFEFPISKALNTINPLTNRPFLVEYYYEPIFINLTEDELAQYKKLTNQVVRLATSAHNDGEYQKLYEMLLFKRANIHRNAFNKLSALSDLLDKQQSVSNTLLFVSDKQIDNVMPILNNKHIFAHRFTEKQGTSPEKKFGGISEREYLIKNFKARKYQALVAITCLDEGIDVPSADTAILMANSTNPREYIQRIGRVIRQSPNKKCAKIFDFIVEPDFSGDEFAEELKQFECRIFEKELIRASEMAANCINNADFQVIIDQKLGEVRRYGTKQKDHGEAGTGDQG